MITNSDCTYPDMETTTQALNSKACTSTNTISLDKASLTILERIQTMEDNLLQRMENARDYQEPAPVADKVTTTVPQTKMNSLWPNGDVIMSWNVMKEAVARCGQHRHWQLYRHQLTPGNDSAAVTLGLSPSIKAEFVSSDIEPGVSCSEPTISDEVALSASVPGSPSVTESLIRNLMS